MGLDFIEASKRLLLLPLAAAASVVATTYELVGEPKCWCGDAERWWARCSCSRWSVAPIEFPELIRSSSSSTTTSAGTGPRGVPPVEDVFDLLRVVLVFPDVDVASPWDDGIRGDLALSTPALPLVILLDEDAADAGCFRDVDAPAAGVTTLPFDLD